MEVQPAQQMKIRVPADVKAYLSAEAERNCSTQNSEIVRALRERMDRAATKLTDCVSPKLSPESL